MAAVLEKQRLMNKESPVAQKIPYKAHLDPYTIKTNGGDFVQVIRLGGAAHESADINNINKWHRSLNDTLRNVAGPDVAIWSHTVRTFDHARLEGEYPEGFARDFNDKYMKSVTGKATLINEIYVTVVHRPPMQRLGMLSKLLGSGLTREQRAEVNEAGVARVEEITSQLVDMLDAYDPVRLSTYKRRVALIPELPDNTVELEYSEPLEFFGFLVNGKWERQPLPKAPLNEALATTRPFFGSETFELRDATDSVFGAVLAVKEYPSQTEPGSLNCLMVMPFPLVIAQSFTFISKEEAFKAIDKQAHHLESAGDAAQTELNQLTSEGGAMDQAASGMVVYGKHHLGVFIYSDTVHSADPAAQSKAVQQVNARLSQARAALIDVGAKIVREDAANEAQFFASLPANFRYRPRLSMISSKNFAGLSSFHNYPIGRPFGNDWGEALTVFRTTSNSLYYFNLHKGKKNAREQRRNAVAEAASTVAGGAAKSDGDEGFSLAHTKIFGPPGTGKTVVEATIYVQALKFHPTGFVFDKDCGLKGAILAVGGRYLELKRGRRSGLSPLQLEPTERNLAFLNALVQELVTGNGEVLTPKDYKDIDRGLRAVMDERIPKKDRRLGRLLELLDRKDPNGVRARLERWCQGGTEGWVFDNDEDELDLTAGNHFGFDMTEFLDIPAVRNPLMMYLFHRMQERINGSPVIIVIAEFWKALQARYFESMFEDWLLTTRKLNVAVIADTQLIASAMKSQAAAAIQNAMATSIYLPNADADWKDYGDEGMKLTRREFHIVKHELGENSRRFLVKQGAASVVCELNLRGFDDELAILSTTGKTRTLLDKVREQVGNDPAVWLPAFHQARRSA